MTQNELILLATVALLSVILILTRRIEAEKCKKKVAEIIEKHASNPSELIDNLLAFAGTESIKRDISPSPAKAEEEAIVLPPPKTEIPHSKLSARETLLLSQLNESVQNNYPNPEFGVDELAETLGMSRSSLNRKMRDMLQTTANNYIREVRIEKAEELLRTSSLQINEICYKVGFQTPSYFIKCFRKKYGKSPNEYANSYS